ncbi:MAG: EAL domain-containing protein [Coriobacteriaceae bacterium]|nr:EAL domain-containing protein [Coriobacteriaceae bacterium]
MLKSHERFHSENGKRLILVADDEAINREILRSILQDDYELIFAENGQVTLDKIRENKHTLALVLLDLMMPVMNGMDVLRQVKADPETQQIPVIVITSDQTSEVESLNIGAIDFIPKPYPQAGVILARIRRTIELSEDRQIINSTERDTLTGLYNREYFYRYAEQFDQHHRNLDMDAIVLDVNHFHMINERFGNAYGDTVLRRIGEAVREMVLDTGGIVCRREADTFMVYCPHGKDYDAILEHASIGLGGDDADENRIRLRMGVYANVDKSLEIERRFDRAKMACDMVRGSFTRRIGIYDDTLREKELYAEQLIEDFPTAIREHQFQVYYQPKFDVQPDIPVLASAEALVRWQHPELGMISPGVFIPLFEDNGLIQALDNYVWSMAAAQIREWKERYDFVVPVSVNVSRIDMYDPHLIDTLQGVLKENGLTTHEFLLEITESAYTMDSEQIIETVNDLRAIGFQIEMDDFGTGYSSLNMISTLPIDALKLDMQFIRNAFNQRKDTKMLEVIIDIADYLSVPVIAEGVETEEQMLALRAMGCDFVQGYYFSRPVPPEEYERFMEERKEQLSTVPLERTTTSNYIAERKEGSMGKIAHALSSGFEVVYYIDTENNYYVKFSSEGCYEDLQIERSGGDFFEDYLHSVPLTVYPDDQERVALSMQKETLLSQLAGSHPFVMTYRLVIDGEPMYYTLKAVRAYTHDNHHIVIGLSNVNEQLKALDSGEHPNELHFSSLAQALSHDVESIYYIDINSDTYMEFKTDGAYRRLELETTGTNFFDECKKNIKEVIFEDDRNRVAMALDKESLLETLRERYVYTLVYRLLIDDEPLYYNMKVVWAEGPKRDHIIIGVSNIDAQITEEEKAEAIRQATVTYASIAHALAMDYFSIYYIDTDNDSFIEYSSAPQYKKLNIETNGDDFFNLSRENIKRVVHPDDIPMILEAFTKEKVMSSLERDETFTLTYRLILDGEPTYVHMKATRMENRADHHIVIGVSNVNTQIRREQEHARAMRKANHDSLTGVKSLHAYSETEQRINQSIASDEQQPFAVAVCDINDLKRVNETLGNRAGDQYIKDACVVVCNVFKHSPVYRVGGDEFVAILQGNDYVARESLMTLLEDNNRMSRQIGGILIAGGLATYEAGADESLAAVYDRANTAMYWNKQRMKGL